ncbi:MraW methylase family protein isoform 3 [Hibiscus syriacus]|uniref:MraW methylase family protein isoform 3 n=1 Tax=Hibiscus syriacus TaxID=106335 RepID=A0A6A2Z6L2_HIBSY|nr:ribosomal RNA small subunit methyltransferase H-like [Hibiscus syriacus]KAE8687498.1 MraW methylase family protein isoform 3 [Hibiscus syriacus]
MAATAAAIANAKHMMRMMLSASLSLPVSSRSASLSAKRFLYNQYPPKSHALVRLSCRSITTDTNKKRKKKEEKEKGITKEKRRTRSLRDGDIQILEQEEDGSSSTSTSTSVMMQQSHVPVMLGEVLDVFSSSSKPLTSFVDCTLGAAGHASAIIQSHPKLKLFIGMDVDPAALRLARSRINAISHSHTHPNLEALTFLKNFRQIKSLLTQVDHISSGVDGILMDLGMSSMQVNCPDRGFSVLVNGPLDMRMDPQASLKAEDILNSWPDSEVGRILRDYGEERNWRLLQNKIVQARLKGGLHSTGELVDVIRRATPGTRGGRQGWIKTATRVFQALRIAVNDELNTLEDSLFACFDCLAPGGRLAVISFHSLEDRIVKQAFLKIINEEGKDSVKNNVEGNKDQNESWIRQTIQGWNGTILTKRPITPSEKEEGFNRRSRSAKLRVIQKL